MLITQLGKREDDGMETEMMVVVVVVVVVVVGGREGKVDILH